MSQYDYGTIDPIPTSGVSLASMLNQYRDAVNSGHYGTSRPSYAVTGMQWVKNVSSTVAEMYFYDGDSDILLCTINPSTNTIVAISQANAENSAVTTVGWWSPQRVWQAITAALTTFKGTANTWTAEQTVSAGFSIGKVGVTSPAASDGNVFSGTYTPTLTNSANIAASTAYQCQYMRLGNAVTVSGRVSIDPTAAGLIQMEMTLPVSSDINNNCFGAIANAFGDAGYIGPDNAGNRARVISTVADIANREYGFTFTYLVV